MQDGSNERNLFMLSFSRFKKKLGEAPNNDIISLAESDEDFREICLDVKIKAETIYDAQTESRQRSFSNANRAFISSWHDYESNYSKQLFGVAMQYSNIKHVVPSSVLGTELEAMYNNVSALIAQKNIELNFYFTQMVTELFPDVVRQIHEKLFLDDDTSLEDFTDELRHGGEDWEKFKKSTGFDLAATMRRFLTTPFVNIPADLSNRQNHKTRDNLIAQLQSAHDAFIFGNNFAATALMRSTMEAALKFYSFKGVYDKKAIKMGELQWRIDNCIGLRSAQLRSDLQNIRLLGNKAMHAADSEVDGTERKFADYFSALVQLIEFAPMDNPANT